MSAVPVRESNAVVRLLSALSAVCLVGGAATPLLLVTDEAPGTGGHWWLIQAIPGLAAAGRGPFSDEAMMASIAVGVFTVVLIASIVLAVAMVAAHRPVRLARAARVHGVLLVLGSSGAALLVMTLSAMWDGRVFWLSPAAGLAMMGATALIVATTLHLRRLTAGAAPASQV